MNLFRHKKSTSGEAPILRQDYGTTPEEKSEAEILFDKIGTGAYHAVKRPGNARTDRRLRKLIAEANMNGDCIIHDGSGYFRPEAEDRPAVERYVRAEMHRAKVIQDKAIAMATAFNRRYQ